MTNWIERRHMQDPNDNEQIGLTKCNHWLNRFPSLCFYISCGFSTIFARSPEFSRSVVPGELSRITSSICAGVHDWEAKSVTDNCIMIAGQETPWKTRYHQRTK